MNPNALGGQKDKVYKLVQYQLLVAVILASLWGLFRGYDSFLAASAGGMVCVLPNFFMAFWLFRHQGAQAARRILRSFFLGEAIKFLVTILLFAIALGLLRLEPLPLLVSFIVTQAVFWASPWITK